MDSKDAARIVKAMEDMTREFKKMNQAMAAVNDNIAQFGKAWKEAHPTIEWDLDRNRPAVPLPVPDVCPTENCEGDPSYSAPGKGHATFCRYPS